MIGGNHVMHAWLHKVGSYCCSIYRLSNKSVLFLLPFILIVPFLLFPSLFLGLFTAQATINNTINFQSKIVHGTNGINISDGSPACVKSGADTCDFQVRIWNHPTNSSTTPGSGNLLFTQTFEDVEIGDTNGIFNLVINSCNSVASGASHWGTSVGDCTVVDDSDADSDDGVNFDRQDLYIEIGFAPADTSGSLGTFTELFTRTSMRSVPSAFVAQSLSGISASGFVQLQPATAQSASGSTSLIHLNEDGGGTPNLIELEVGGTDYFVVANSGQLQLPIIGSTGGILIGGDVNLYDGGTNLLMTDSSFQINGNTILGNASTDNITFTGEILGGSPLTFEGSTNDNIYTIFNITDPTSSNKTITFRDLSGTVAYLSDITTGLWSDGSTFLYPADTTDNIVLGSSSAATAGILLNADGSAIFNEQGASVDFRIESDTQANMFFVDGSANAIGVGTNTPGAPLHVALANSDGIHAYFGYLGIAGSGDPGTTSRYGPDIWASGSILGFNSPTIVFQTEHPLGGIGPLERMRITNSGNIGINTTTPTALLEIDGEYRPSILKVNKDVVSSYESLGMSLYDDYAYSVVEASDGSFAMTGYSTGGGAGGNDIEVYRYGNTSTAFNRLLGGAGSDTATSIATTSDGGFIVAGTTTTAGFLSAGSQGAYVVKLSSSGTVEWSKTYSSGTSTITGRRILQDSTGNYVLLFNQVSGSDEYCVVMKVNSIGDVVWNTYIDGNSGSTTETDRCTAIIESSDYSGYVITGTTNAGGAGGYDLFAIKLNYSGVSAWHRVVGGSGTDAGWDLVQKADGGYLIAGETSSYGAGGSDGYLVELSSSGSLISTKVIGYADANSFRGIDKTSDGGYIVVSGVETASTSEFYYHKLDSNLNVTWSRDATNGISSQGMDVIQESSGGYVLVGQTSQSPREMVRIRVNSSGDCAGCSYIVTPSAPSTTTGGSSNTLSNYATGTLTYTTGSGASSNSASASSSLLCTANTSTVAFEVTKEGTSINSTVNVNGDIFASKFWGSEVRLSNFDLAEEYDVDDTSIGAGDVVRFKLDSATNNLVVERAEGRYDEHAIGVISTEPGVYLKDWAANKFNGRPVALAGRVPVKVTDENGPIKRGDFLTTSSTPGYAMKATDPGQIIGRAMEDFTPGIDSGDSQLVSQFKDEQVSSIENIAEKLKVSGEITDDDADNIVSAVSEVSQEISNQEPKAPNTGRIMMFVDLDYRGEKIIEEEIAGVDSMLNIESFDLANGNQLFEIIENEEGKIAKISVTEFVVSGALKVEGNLSVTENINATSMIIIDLIVNGRLTLNRGENGQIGSVSIPAGQVEVVVSNTSVKEDTLINVTVDQFVMHRIKEINPGVGFVVELSEAIESDTKITYVLY